MPDYKYNAIDRNGAQTSGKIDAASEEQARSKLMARGLMVTTLAGTVPRPSRSTAVTPRRSRASASAPRSPRMT